MKKYVRAACGILSRSLVASLILLSTSASGYLINGTLVSDGELAEYRSAWDAEVLAAAATSAVAKKEHQGILDLIAALEAQGATGSPPCRELVLTAIVRGPATDYVQFTSGHKYGPLSFFENWRVLACGRKHSWFTFVGQPPRSELEVAYGPAPNDDWMQFPRPKKVRQREREQR